MLVEVRVGIVGRAHGIRGDVVVELRTDDPELRFAEEVVLREENGRRRFTVDGSRWHSGRLLVRFRELTDRTAAEKARGVVLVTEVDADERPDDPDELYDRQLIGLRVVDAAGTDRGAVTQVVHVPGQDLLEVDTAIGKRLVPFVNEIVVDVDLAAQTIRLADVTGLLEDLEDTEDLDGTDLDEDDPDQDDRSDPDEHPVPPS